MNAANPLFIYTTVWSVVLGLASLQMTANLHELNAGTLILIGSNIATFFIWFMIFPSPSIKPSAQQLDATLREAIPFLDRFLTTISTLWAIGTAIEVYLCGGVPLLWAFSQGFSADYTHFGIPTLHGLLNSLFFFSITARFLRYLVLRERLDLILTGLLLAWPVLMLGRGILLGALCQTTGLYLTLFPLSSKMFVKLTCLVLVVIWAFGAIGDLRGTANPFDYLVNDQYRPVFDNLSSGYLWFYVYLTSPIGNIIYNVDTIQPCWYPNYSVNNLVPTAIREFFSPGGTAHNFQFVDENLNVSTFYAGYLSDFGLYGAIAVVAGLQLIITLVYRSAEQHHVWALLAYSVLFQCVVFSVFYDLFMIQVYIFQLVLAVMFESQLRRHRRDQFWKARHAAMATSPGLRLQGCLR